MVDVLLLAGTGLRFTCGVREAVPHFMQQPVWEACVKFEILRWKLFGPFSHSFCPECAGAVRGADQGATHDSQKSNLFSLCPQV